MAEKKSKKKSFLNKISNGIIAVLLVIFVFAAIANRVGEMSADATVESIRSGEVNPPQDESWVTKRQNDFVSGIKQEILTSADDFDNLAEIEGASDSAKVRRKRAKEEIYLKRKAAWANLTTPLSFDDFSGVVSELKTSKVAWGEVNSGRTKLTVKVKLFGSGIIIEDSVLLDDNDQPVDSLPQKHWNRWEILGKNSDQIEWFTIEKGEAVSVSGKFNRYSKETQWAHCCIASTDWPVFRADFNRLQKLTE